MKRRTFAAGTIATATGLAIDSTCRGRWMQTLASELRANASGSVRKDRVLVVVQLSGGNDGLNTVIPHRNELYRKARPKLGVPSSDVIEIADGLGLHPSLKSLEGILSDGRMSIVQGVGYESPNRSHFESMDIWQSCRHKKDRAPSGWLGRWISENGESERPDSLGVHVGSESVPLAFLERGVQVPSVASLEQMRLKAKLDRESPSGVGGESESSSMKAETSVGTDGDDTDPGLLSFVETSTNAAIAASMRLESTLAQSETPTGFPASRIGEKLQVISRLILAAVTTQIYYVTLDGFDTHANQSAAHEALLRQWSEAVAAFTSRMKEAGQHDRVLMMTFSEFGRRVAENASLGTDHGAAAPMFFAGPELPNLLVGDHPSLSDLDDGDLKFGIDFRAVYAAVIEDWLGTSSFKSLAGDYRQSALGLNLFQKRS
ncbi:MAG: DUF1501 domain-containing protein [Planctomycetes bacterium]|nr:DUF1501 domain-containing protein [Planctomycetota bacterium]